MTESFFARWSRIIKATPISKVHRWEETGRFGVRVCHRCGTHDYLSERRYPSVGEAKYSWPMAETSCRPIPPTPAPGQSEAIRAEVIAQGVDPNSDKAERMGRAIGRNMLRKAEKP